MLKDFDDIKTSDFYDSDSQNFFDVQHEFFVIDSEHLDDVKTRMYGFSVQSNGIFEEGNMTAEAVKGLDGCGSYVYIERNFEEGWINIYQDYNGNYGIYMFQNDDYFALSNSFFCLLDHIKYRFPLSLNRDYANLILLDNLASYAYSETVVNEIQLLPKDVIIHINKNLVNYQLEFIDYMEDSYTIDTTEGIAILDKWFHKWINIFKNIYYKTDQIVVNLSGGFDSRLSFMLMLKSGIDLNKIRVSSFNDNLHTHSEDYQIATEIASFYGIKLNNKKLSGTAIHYSLKDIINIAFYTKMTFHKELYYKYHKFYEKRYVIPGSGGEAIRTYWNISIKEFIKQQEDRTQRYSAELANDISTSVRKILENDHNKICKKYNIIDKNSKNYMGMLRRETRDRSHFGKAIVEDFFTNTYTITPMIDPDIRKLKLCTDSCQDKNLLITLIFVRYCPSLLNFRFEGNRTIKPETIKIAQEINENFPINDESLFEKSIGNFIINLKDEEVNDKIKNGKDNVPIKQGIPDEYLKSAFDSCSLRKLFATYFDEEIYTYANKIANETNFYPLRECYAVIGITRVIESILVGSSVQKPSIEDELDRFITNNYYNINDYTEIIKNSRDFLTARIDVIFKGLSSEGELIKISDKKAKVTNPEWIQKNGKGYVIESCCGKLQLIFRSLTEGEIYISLKGRDVRDKDNNRVPYWIDIIDYRINNERQLDEMITVCHDKPFNKTYHMNSNDIITINLKWKPHNNEYIVVEEEKDKVEDKIPNLEGRENDDILELSTWEFLKYKARKRFKK